VAQTLRILLVSSEVEPFAKTGGLADVAGALPKALKGLGHDVRVLMPRYRGVEQHAHGLAVTVPHLAVPVGRRTVDAALLEGRLASTIPVYFLAQDHYYDREALYGPPGGAYPDNCERFIVLCRGALEAVRSLGWTPQVIHTNDWQTGLVPVYLETLYAADPVLGEVATIFTIHNMAFQGRFWHYDMPLTGLGWDLFTPAGIEFYGDLCFLKGGLVFADLLTTVSETYAEEIKTPEFGHGLEGVLQARSADLRGITNGIDDTAWDPATDGHIAKPYTADELVGKSVCKQALVMELRLVTDDSPLIGIVSRLAAQKGLDLVLDALPRLVAAGAQLVVLGSGDPDLERRLLAAQAAHPQRVAVRVGYDGTLARRIFAGADMTLMPSRFEPCGLSQMISMRYGTIPIVRWTGGLRDTVTEVRPGRRTGTGFGFAEATADALVTAVTGALHAYRDQTSWRQIMRTAMGKDFSWRASARKYATLYGRAIQAARRGQA
jgi:starch synthase